MADISTLSALANDSTLTNGATITHTEHNTHRTNYRDLINNLLTVVTDLENNYSSGSQPGDTPAGKIWHDSSNNLMKWYKTSSFIQLIDDSSTQTLTGKTLAGFTLTGDVTSTGTAIDWDLIDNNASALSFDAAGKAGIIALVTTDSSEGVTMSGTLAVTGITTLSTDLNIYEATNDGNPEIRLGAADAEELHIQAVYDSGAQTLDYVIFQTDAASATTDKGEFRFNVDGTLISQVNDSGFNLESGLAYYINDTSVLNATTLGSAVVTSSLTTVGALNSGSISSGFGAIDNGTSNITTGGIVKMDVDGSAINAAGSLTFGAGNDAGLWHDGTNTLLSNITGDLILETQGTGGGIIYDAEDDTHEWKNSGTIAMNLNGTGLSLGSSAATANLHTYDGTVIIGDQAWPSSTVGQAGNRVLITDASEAFLILNNANDTLGAGNSSDILLGARATAATNNMAYGVIRGGKENASSGDLSSFIDLRTLNAVGSATTWLSVSSAGVVSSSGILRIAADGSAINSAGSIGFGAADTDSAIYWNGTNLEIDTSSGIDFSVSGTAIAVLDSTGLGIGGAPSYDFDIDISNSGSDVSSRVKNASNTASSNAVHYISSAGSSGGDASVVLSVTGATDWSIGVDNDDSDKIKIGASSAVGTSSFLIVDSSGRISTGQETAPDVDPGGLCINTGANDGFSITLKNSDVAHGMTSEAETDTFGKIGKWDSAGGGLSLRSYSETDEGFFVISSVTTEDTTDTSASDANITMYASLKSGTSVTSHQATANIFAISNNNSVQFLCKGNGDLHATNTTITALDTYNDIQLARDLQLAVTSKRKHEVSKAGLQNLIDAGALSSTGEFQVFQGVTSVSLGAISQLWNVIRGLGSKMNMTEAQLIEFAREY